MTRALPLAAFVAFSTMNSASAQETYDWTGGAGNANWNDGGNWTNTTPGGTGSFPGIGDTVTFAIDAVAGDGAALNVNIDVGVTFPLGGGTITTLDVGDGGVIVNDGTFAFANDTLNHVSGVPDQVLRIGANASVSLEGSGDMLMSGGESGIDGAGSASSTLSQASTHSVSGPGVIQQLSLIHI